MKKRILAILISVPMLFGTVFLSSCSEEAAAPTSESASAKSAYDLAVENGYEGTVEDWLASLVGEAGENGKSAYDLAVDNGYKATQPNG